MRSVKISWKHVWQFSKQFNFRSAKEIALDATDRMKFLFSRLTPWDNIVFKVEMSLLSLKRKRTETTFGSTIHEGRKTGTSSHSLAVERAISKWKLGVNLRKGWNWSSDVTKCRWPVLQVAISVGVSRKVWNGWLPIPSDISMEMECDL